MKYLFKIQFFVMLAIVLLCLPPMGSFADGPIYLMQRGAGRAIINADSSFTVRTSSADQLKVIANGNVEMTGAISKYGNNTPTDGQLLIGNSAGKFDMNTLTAGAGITITNAAGGITLTGGRLASFSLNANNATYQTVYTVPTGKNLVIERLVYRSPTADISATAFRCQNSGTVTVLYSAAMAGLTSSTGYGVQTFAEGHDYQVLQIITAGNALQCKPTLAFGSAATVTVDVFGYLY